MYYRSVPFVIIHSVNKYLPDAYNILNILLDMDLDLNKAYGLLLKNLKFSGGNHQAHKELNAE
jgi:hypothetical protein